MIRIRGHDDPWVQWLSIGYSPTCEELKEIMKNIRGPAERRMVLVTPPIELGNDKSKIMAWFLQTFHSDDPYFIWGIILDHERKVAV